MPRRLMAVCFSLLLASCSSARYAVPERGELTHLVLLIKESPEGQVSHYWESAEDFDLSRFKYQSNLKAVDRRIVLVAAQQDDCYTQYLESS